MVERQKSAESEGPVLLKALLHDRFGTVHVRVDPECKRASVRVTTADREGVAAQAINRGQLEWDESARQLTVDIAAPGASPSAGWPVQIWAELPPGSRVDAHTQMANVETTGPKPLRDASIETTTGEVSIEDAIKASVKTTSGPVHIEAADEAVVRTQGDPDAPIPGEVVALIGADTPPPSPHVTVGRVETLDVQTTNGPVEIDEAPGSLAVKTGRGGIVIKSLSAEGSDVRSTDGWIDATVTGGHQHALSSPYGVVNVTVEYTAPRDVKVKAADIRGSGRVEYSQGFIARYVDPRVGVGRDAASTGAGAGAGGAGGGAAGASAASGAAAAAHPPEAAQRPAIPGPETAERPAIPGPAGSRERPGGMTR